MSAAVGLAAGPISETAGKIIDKFNFKLIGSIIIIGIILTIIVIVYKKIKRKIEAKRALTEAKNDINKQKLSYQISQYAVFADSLTQAMKGPGTDTTAIYNIFYKMNNKDDLLQLIISFGVRESKFLGVTVFSGVLSAWLADELKASEIQKLNQILATKDINFYF